MGKWEWEIESTPSPGDDSIISQATHPPTTTQLLTMKECSHKKVSLVKMSLDDLLDPSGKKNNQVAIDNNNRGESNMIKEKVINKLKLINNS